MTIERTIMQTIDSAKRLFSVVFLAGPRGIGKKEAFLSCDKSRNYVSLRNFRNRLLAKENPSRFLERHTPPLLIDGIEYAPELFTFIKVIVDIRKEKDLYWFTSNHQYSLMAGIEESLAGRMGVLNLYGLSLQEILGQPSYEPFLPTKQWLSGRKSQAKPLTVRQLSDIIARGSFPQVVADETIVPRDFYSAYVTDLIERDIREITGTTDLMLLYKFLVSLAAKSARPLNFSEVARDVGVTVVTAQKWTTALETLGIVYLLHPYWKNIGGRMTKMPKPYFTDTGLLCHLLGENAHDLLMSSPLKEVVFETFVVMEIIKSYRNHGARPPVSYYRDKDKKEIDLLIDQNGKLHPIAIRATEVPNMEEVKDFDVLKKSGMEIGEGAVICLYDEPQDMTDSVTAVPAFYL